MKISCFSYLIAPRNEAECISPALGTLPQALSLHHFGLGSKAAIMAQDMWFLRRTGQFSQIIDQPGKRIRRWPAFGILFLHSAIRRMHIQATSKWIENASQD
jgi:hypothetical protein